MIENPMIETSLEETTVNPADAFVECDAGSCRARGAVHLSKEQLTLRMCGHHARKHSDKLVEDGWLFEGRDGWEIQGTSQDVASGVGTEATTRVLFLDVPDFARANQL